MQRRFSGTATVMTAVLVLSIAGGCRTARQVAARYPRSDIESIYADLQDNAARNPVVLVHGFAGSTLRRLEDDATVWGAFFTDDALAPGKPEGLRAFALDIDGLDYPVEPQDLLSIADDTRAVELLEKVRADAGVADFNVGVYSALVELMETSGYSECQSDPTAIQNLEAPPCLAFFYDWRQDNVGNAIKLGRFLERARERISQLRSSGSAEDGDDIRFDVIAHSMGGLVSRYFLRFGPEDVLGQEEATVAWAGADYVDRLIVISTPSFGATRVLREMVTGRRYPLVKFEPAMIASWVSSYQMLPRPEHRIWLDEKGEPTEVDILSAKTWLFNGWGPFAPGQDRYLAWVFPGEASPAVRRKRMSEFMDAAFARTRQFFKVMDQHPTTPCPAELILFAADVQPTPALVAVIPKGDRRVLRFESVANMSLKAPGDGSVTRASAVADERLLGTYGEFVSSPIPWSQQVFLTDMHMTFLGNPTFQNNLLHILLEVPPSRRVSTE